MSVVTLKAKRVILKGKIGRLSKRLDSAKKKYNSLKPGREKNKYGILVTDRSSLLSKYRQELAALNKQIAIASGLKQFPAKWNVSKKGLDLIKSFEGFVPTVQDDGFGNPTVGYGHVVSYRSDSAGTAAGKKAAFEKKYGKVISEEDAVKLLKSDLESKYEPYLNAVEVPISQNQFNATLSAVYNLGPAFVHKSTFIKKLNALDYNGAANEFLKWDMANGKHEPGLERRRRAERKLFLAK